MGERNQWAKLHISGRVAVPMGVDYFFVNGTWVGHQTLVGTFILLWLRLYPFLHCTQAQDWHSRSLLILLIDQTKFFAKYCLRFDSHAEQCLAGGFPNERDHCCNAATGATYGDLWPWESSGQATWKPPRAPVWLWAFPLLSCLGLKKKGWVKLSQVWGCWGWTWARGHFNVWGYPIWQHNKSLNVLWQFIGVDFSDLSSSCRRPCARLLGWILVVDQNWPGPWNRLGQLQPSQTGLSICQTLNSVVFLLKNPE